MALYRCIGGGGEEPSYITPSNLNPPVIGANNLIKALGDGYAIQFYNNLTPSNSSPAEISNGYIYKATASGAACENIENITPSNVSPADITSGNIYKAESNGKAVASITDVTPSNSSPVALTSGDIDKMGGNGYAIESYENLIPSNGDPQTIEIGEIYKATNNGKAVASVTEVDPYEPDFMSRGGIYTPTDHCFAIANSLLTTITPSNSNPATITSGKFHDAKGNGYAFATDHPQFPITHPGSSVTTAATSFSISNKKGKELLVFLFYSAGSAAAYNRLDGATASGGTLTKLCNLKDANATAYGTFYTIKPTSDTCTITAPYSCFYHVFEG